jgi:hypothetical protein
VIIVGVASQSTPSPFRPGYGSRPLVLAGREELQDDVDDAIALLAEERRAPNALIIVGPRGVGKSVMLDEVARRAQEQHGWVRIHVQKDDGSTLDERLIVETRNAHALLEQSSDERTRRMRMEELSVKGGLPFGGLELGATFRRPAPDTVAANPAIELTERLRALADLAVAMDTAVVITIDEGQDASKEEFGSFGTFGQEITRHDLPFLVAIAGLPSLDNKRLSTYFVRAERHEIGSLTREEARRALTEPADQAGRPFDVDAAEVMLDQIGGYPFAVQIYGREAWRQSQGAGTISLAAVERALPAAARRLDRTVHRDHWAQASPAEREYLVAVAELARDRAPFTGGDVAQRLGKPVTSLSEIRSRLLAMGALTYDGQQLAFATPGMGAYILKQASGGNEPPLRPDSSGLFGEQPDHLRRGQSTPGGELGR